MNDKISCVEFSDRLAAFALGRSSPAEAAMMREHLGSCVECREIFEIKKTLTADLPEVPADVERDFLEAVISDVASAKEAGRSRPSWTRRYLLPAMAAAIFVFVFLTGYLIGEIRHLHREAGQLRGEVTAMETVLEGRSISAEGSHVGGSVFGRMAGSFPAYGKMTVGEARRFLEALPQDTPVLTEEEATRLIAGNSRIRRLAGHLDKRPWEGGLTSGELLLVIVALDLDPETRIPVGLRNTKAKI
jgi:hypothetical protein